MNKAIELVLQLAVPTLFVLGVHKLFRWDWWGLIMWLACAVAAAGSALVPGALGRMVFVLPIVHLSLFHVLRIAVYRSTTFCPPAVLFDFRKSVGTTTDRAFSVLYVLASLSISFVITVSAK